MARTAQLGQRTGGNFYEQLADQPTREENALTWAIARELNKGLCRVLTKEEIAIIQARIDAEKEAAYYGRA